MRKNKNLKKLVIFAIASLMCLGVLNIVDAEISGSEITAVTTGYTSGTSATLEFFFDYESSDYEYIDGFYLDFPTGVTVTSAQSSVGGAPWNGETGDGVLTSWGDLYGYCSGYGYFYSDQTFTVDVDIDSGFSGDMDIFWEIFGDCYGSTPHSLSGTLTISEAAADFCYFEEDFSGGYTDWTVSGGWDISSTSNAGGTSPEARLYWSYATDGDYIQSNPVDTSSETDLWMSFRNYIDYYSTGCSFYVEVTPDGSTWYDVTPWTNPITANVPANRWLLNIPQAIGTQTSVRFTFNGEPYAFDYWYLDDIKICDFITFKDVAMLNIIQPDPYATGGWTTLIPVQTRVANNGNTPQSIDVNVKITHEVGGGTLLFEDFDSAWDSANPPTGWHILDLAGGSDGIWNNNDWYRYTSYSGCPRVYYSPYEDDQDEWLISPSVNCGAESEVHVLIDYMNSYIYNGGTPTSHLYIEGSTDGGFSFPHPIDDWQDGDTMEGSEYDVDYDISSWAAGQSDVMIRFRMINPGSGSSYRSCYWYFNDFSIYAPTSTVVDYDVTQTESFAAGEVRNVLFPDFAFPPAGIYDVTATVTLAGDEDPSNDQISVLEMPIGDVDAAINSIDTPMASTIGPIDYTPEVTVSQVTAWDDLSVPVNYAIYEQPYTSAWDTKVTEDFEGYIGFNSISNDQYRGIEITNTNDREGQLAKASAQINWLEEPNVADPGEWTIIDENWDDVTWNPSDARASQGTTSMWMGDPNTGTYPTDSYDWFISPVFNAGDACRVNWDWYYDVESGYDYMYVLWSPDFYNWGGYYFPYNYPAWESWSLACPDPNYINDDGSCYVAFLFYSDYSMVQEGVYLDNIEIEGSSALYTETVDVILDGTVTQSVTFSQISGILDFDKNYIVQAAVQHPRDITSANNEMSFAFDTFVKIYNTRTGIAYNSIQAAIDDPLTLDGDTIFVRDGDYYEDINIYKELTITAENPAVDGTSYLFGTVDITADNVIFENFYVKPLTLFSTDQAAIAIYANNAIVRNNIVEIEGLTSGTIKGIHAYATPSNNKEKIEISNNIVRDVKNAPSSGVVTHYFNDFESNNGGWVPTATWDPVGDWEWSNTYNVGCYVGGEQPPPTAYSGTGLWGTVLCDDYTNSGGETLLSQNFDFTGLSNAHLQFWEWSDLFGSYDYGEVLVNGVQEYYIDSYPGTAWQYVDLDLSAYDGMSSVDIVFSMHASTVVEYAGWYIDDVTITGTGTATIGGAVGIMVQGAVWDVDVLGNEVYDIHSGGWSHGIEVTPTALDPAVGSGNKDLMHEGFEGDFPPAGWSTYQYGGTRDWQKGTYGTHSYEPTNYGAGSHYADCWYSGGGTWDTGLFTPHFNFAALGVSAATLSWAQNFQDMAGYGQFEVRGYSGGSMVESIHYDTTDNSPSTGGIYLSYPLNLGLYTDLSDVYFEFWYTDDYYGDAWGVGVDEVVLNVDYSVIVNPWPLDVNIEENHIYRISLGPGYTWPDPPVYDGVMLTIDYATLPTGGPTPADASEVTVIHNWFDPDCYYPTLAILNMDLAHCLMAGNNYFGYPNGPGSFDPTGTNLVYDCLNGEPANGGGSQIVLYGPVHFYPFLGVKAIHNIASPVSATVGIPVSFDGSASWAKDFSGIVTPVEFYWKFDDGHYSFQDVISHAYTAPGTYDGYLRVKSPGIPEFGIPPQYDWSYFTIVVSSPDAPLGANAGGGSLSHYEVSNGEQLTLSGLASGGTAPYSYSWDLGDGRTVTGQNPTIVYWLDEENPVTTEYTVTLTVVDANYDVATDTATVTVLAPGELIVSINAPANSNVDLPVTFTSVVSGGTLPYTYLWEIGDGTIYDLKNPTHIFQEAGTYTVTLTVTDDTGKVKTATHTIQVQSGEEENPAVIKQVSGGFRVKATIAAGTNDCDWTMKVDGKLLFFGGEASGKIQAGKEETVKLPLTFAIGKVDITVTANEIQKKYTAFALGPLFLSVKEA